MKNMSDITFLQDMVSKSAEAKRQILRLCIINGPFSIADLSKDMNTSVPTITKLISELMRDGLIRDLGKHGTSGGRRPSIFGLDAKAGHFLGVDVGSKDFKIAVTDFNGEEVLFTDSIPFVLEASAESLKEICRIIRNEVTKAGIEWESVLEAGISLSGRVNPEEGYSLTYSVSDDFPLKTIFQNELHVPVIIENDSRAMTYGEYLAGNNESAEKNMLFINISWGLGMGMILDGNLYYGKSGFSGEIGHFPLLNNGKICRCGKMGCLETGASGSALYHMIKDELAAGRNSSLSKKFKSGEKLHLNDVLEAVKEEDVLAIEGIETVGETLGRCIAGLINVFNPGQVIIGGRLAVGGKYLLYSIKSAVNKYSLIRVSSDTKIRFSTLGAKAAATGACLIARSRLLGLM